MRFQIFIFTLLLAPLSFADHPNEGSLAIEQLILEAQENNLELKQAEERVKASEFLLKSQFGKFFPELSLEGGPLYTKWDTEKNNGTAVYGKVEWNLYRGGADSFQIEKMKLAHQLEQTRLDALKFKIRREVTRVYYEMLFVLESIALKERAISMNTEQMKLAWLKKNSGFTSQGDVIEFELRESTLKSDLLLLNQEREQKTRELDVLLSRKERSQSYAFKGHLIREQPQFSRVDLSKKILEKNLELTEISTEARSAELDKKVIFSEFLPRVDLEGQYGKLMNEATVSSDQNNYSFMLKVKIPLFSGFEKVNANRSQNSLSASKQMEVDQKRLAVMAELDHILGQIQLFNQRLDIEEKNLARSEEYYKITLGEYKRGVKNSPDMVGASERLIEARIRNLEYRRDLMVAQLRIFEMVNSDSKSFQ